MPPTNMKDNPLTEMKYGWRREDSSAAPKAPRENSLYQQARPASLSGVPDKWLNVRSATDRQKARLTGYAAVAKPVGKNDKSA